jgi:predicted dehydrogenase
MISPYSYLLGEKPVSVSAHGMASVFEDIYDVVHMNLIFPNRLPAYIHVSWLDPCKVRRVTVVGSQKMIVYNDLNNEQKIKIYDKGVDVPAYTNGGFDEFQCNYRSGDIVIPKIQMFEPLRKECQHFLDCIANNEQPRSNGDDGLSVIKILEAAQRSMANGSTHEVIQW